MIERKVLNLTETIEFIKGKKVLCFGAGIQGKRMIGYLENWGFLGNLIAYADNNINLQGTYVTEGGYSYPVISLKEAVDIADENTIILITSIHFKEMYLQIEEMSSNKRVMCMAIDEVADEQLLVSDYENVVRESEEQLIPKVIHFAWLGNDMPDKMKRNIENWQKVCPDYEIKMWSEKNYDVRQNAYMEEAYEAKMWGFVPDYIRLDIVYKYGGIYLDTDIEIVRNLDELLYQECFSSVDASLTMNLGSGFGARKGCEIIKQLRDYYDTVRFINADGTYDKTSCNTHSFRVLNEYGVKINDKLQKIGEMNIYPMVFQGSCQYTRKIRVTEKTYFVHYGNMSWF